MCDKQRQRGVTLLLTVLIMMLASITYIFTDISTDEIQIERKIINSRVLKEAKNALLAHALTNSYRATNLGEVGNLPCPDVNNTSTEGNQDPSCGALNRNTIGYFPWKRMGIEILKDESGACLLYAVSPSYKMNDPRMLNQDSNGLFQIVDMDNIVIDGILPEDRIVAIIFASNAAVGNQTRSFDNTTLCGKDFSNLSAYLDDTGVKNNSVLSGEDNTIDQFVHATSTSPDNNNPLNDTFITIKKSEIWNTIFSKTRLRNKLGELTEAITVCLSGYANNGANVFRQLPWPAPLDLSASPNNGYFNDDNYDDVDAAAQGYAGRLPYKVDSSNAKTGMIGVDLFTAATCTAIDLPSTGAVVETIDLSSTGEHGIIWHNWKDHFYYALSKNYQPDITATGDSVCNGVNGCVSMNGVSNEFAAIVFFSDVSRNGVTRTSAEAGDPNQKAIIANYIENDNDTDFPDGSGEGDYQSGLANSNDLMFCINDMPAGNDLTVVAC